MVTTHSITYNGINSLDYGLYVSGHMTFNSASKDYSKVSVPGRSGDLLLFNNRYKNVNVEYPAVIFKDFEENSTLVRNWLLSSNGYCRLEDTYHPDEYRMALFTGPVNFSVMLLEVGSTSLSFDCKPQRWLKSGEIKQSFTGSTNGIDKNIINPTLFDAKPLIRVSLKSGIEGDCTLSVGTGSITIKKDNTTAGDQDTYLDIDCETMNCYGIVGENATINKNNEVIIHSWPILKPGKNGIITQDSNRITKVEIIPRWWML